MVSPQSTWRGSISLDLPRMRLGKHVRWRAGPKTSALSTPVWVCRCTRVIQIQGYSRVHQSWLSWGVYLDWFIVYILYVTFYLPHFNLCNCTTAPSNISGICTEPTGRIRSFPNTIYSGACVVLARQNDSVHSLPQQTACSKIFFRASTLLCSSWRRLITTWSCSLASLRVSLTSM